MDDIAPQTSTRASQRSACPTTPVEVLSWLGDEFLYLDAALLAGEAEASPGLLERWWAVVQAAVPIRARAVARGRRIKARMLLAVIRQTGADGPVCDLAQSLAHDLTGQPRRKRKTPSLTEARVEHFVKKGLSRRAATVLTQLGCHDTDAVVRLGPGDFAARQNCGRVTTAELQAFVQQLRRLPAEH